MSASHLVVMGVSGCGKTTVGKLLARALQAGFIDADSLHPAANTVKMAAGVPLDDDDRKPWLELIGEAFAGSPEHPLVIACSALKRSYRDSIRAADPTVGFIHLSGAESLLLARLAGRTGHFMPPALLRSQLDTIQALETDEAGVTLELARPPEELAREAAQWAGRRQVA